MRFLWFAIMMTILLLTIGAQGEVQNNQPATQPVRPPSRMTAELTGPVSLQGEVPITLRLFSETEGERLINNYSFMFVLLDEDGHQVGVPHVFIREAVKVDAKLDGRESTYNPRLAFYRGRKGLVVGRKYQLVCIMPQCDLVSAVWFTSVP